MYKAETIAKYLIDAAFGRYDKPLTNIRLQLMLFLIQLEYVKEYDKLLFKDRFEARTAGPVIPALYYEYAAYGGCSLLLNYDTDTDIDVTTRVFLSFQLKRLIKLKSHELFKAAHDEKLPWFSVRNSGAKEIPNCLFFETAAQEKKEPKPFLYKLVYHHRHTGVPYGCRIGFIEAASKEEAHKKLWSHYGNDYTTLAMADIIPADSHAFELIL